MRLYRSRGTAGELGPAPAQARPSGPRAGDAPCPAKGPSALSSSNATGGNEGKAGKWPGATRAINPSTTSEHHHAGHHDHDDHPHDHHAVTTADHMPAPRPPAHFRLPR